MFTCYVFAPCEKPTRNELSPYPNKLTPTQLQTRMTRSLVFLKSRLPNLPTIVETTEHPEQAAVTILSTHNIATDLAKCGLYVIDFGEPRKFPAGIKHLFYIRATLTTAPRNGDSVKSVLEQEQKKIGSVIKEAFNGEVGPADYPFTYLIPTDNDTNGHGNAPHKNRPDLAQLWKIEAALLQNGLSAELGLKYIPESNKNLSI